MSHSNRSTLPTGFLWGWDVLPEARRPVASADPRMEVQPPDDPGYMPNVTTTPPPPEVWMAGTSQTEQDQRQRLLRALQILQAGT
jgi:hypothetical protein